MANPTILEQLSRVTHELDVTQIAKPSRDTTTAHVFDALGCMISGLSKPAFSATKRYLGASGVLESSIASRPGTVEDLFPSKQDRCDLETTAMLLGAPAFIDNYGDTSLYSVTHPNTVIVPAAIAASRDRETSASAFLSAILSGYQVMEYLARSLNNGTPRMAHQVRGFRPTASCGPAGAAAAACLLFGLSSETTAHAIGIACNMAAGLRRTDASETTHMRIHSGEATRRGIAAALLAQAGITVDRSFIEAPGGFFEAMRDGALDEQASDYLTDPPHLAVEDVALKLHATPHTLAPGLDCLIELVRAEPDLATIVEHVVIKIPKAHAAISYEASTVDVATLNATDALDHFRFCAALVLHTGDIVLPDTPKAFVGDPRIGALADRIELVIDPHQDAVFTTVSGSWPARVEIETTRGSRALERLHPLGLSLDPTVKAALERKFRAITNEHLSTDRADRTVAFFESFDRSLDVYGDLRDSVIGEPDIGNGR